MTEPLSALIDDAESKKPCCIVFNWGLKGYEPQEHKRLTKGDKVELPLVANQITLKDGTILCFLGWYTAITGGVKVESPVIAVNETTTYWAHWSLGNGPWNSDVQVRDYRKYIPQEKDDSAR